MKPELQEKLYKKYPKIFRQKKLPMTETAMCWGICTGDGWYSLIDSLCGSIQFRVDNKNMPQVEAAQVKEKFGGLRFYTDGNDDCVEAMIDLAMAMSFHICEECGTTKDASQNKRGWVRTLCPECRGRKK